MEENKESSSSSSSTTNVGKTCGPTPCFILAINTFKLKKNPPPGKSQVAICLLRNTGTDQLEQQLDPGGPIAARVGPYGLLLNL